MKPISSEQATQYKKLPDSQKNYNDENSVSNEQIFGYLSSFDNIHNISTYSDNIDIFSQMESIYNKYAGDDGILTEDEYKAAQQSTEMNDLLEQLNASKTNNINQSDSEADWGIDYPGIEEVHAERAKAYDAFWDGTGSALSILPESWETGSPEDGIYTNLIVSLQNIDTEARESLVKYTDEACNIAANKNLSDSEKESRIQEIKNKIIEKKQATLSKFKSARKEAEDKLNKLYGKEDNNNNFSGINKPNNDK